MKALILGNQAAAVANFWIPLIKRLREGDATVTVAVPFPEGSRDREAIARLEEAGAAPRYYPLARKGLNPLQDAATFRALFSLFRQERPDLLFATTIKPVIWGNLAARLAGVKRRYSMITGLGFAFETDTLPKKILSRVASFLYRRALRGSSGIFFQNSDDLGVFRSRAIISPHAPVRLFPEGTGVDTARFAPVPLPAGAPVFLLVGRLLEAKGIREYARAAALLKAKYPDAHFLLLGSEEKGAGAIRLDELRSLTDGNIIEYLGETSDVRPFVAQASVMVLPSWREGVPCSLMEGMAMGRCAVATDVPGCRDLVRDGENGLLVPLRDSDALAAAMERFIADPALAPRLGRTAREMMERSYEARRVANTLAQSMGA